jgi:hypothetical protein
MSLSLKCPYVPGHSRLLNKWLISIKINSYLPQQDIFKNAVQWLHAIVTAELEKPLK